jgi:hypothetical protein
VAGQTDRAAALIHASVSIIVLAILYVCIPWVGAVLDGFLAVFPPFVSILRKAAAVPTGLDLESVLVLHLAHQHLLRGR